MRGLLRSMDYGLGKAYGGIGVGGDLIYISWGCRYEYVLHIGTANISRPESGASKPW